MEHYTSLAVSWGGQRPMNGDQQQASLHDGFSKRQCLPMNCGRFTVCLRLLIADVLRLSKEGKETRQLLLRRMPGIFANLEDLGVSGLRSFLLAVPLDQLCR